MTDDTIKDKVALVGIGETQYYKRGAARAQTFAMWTQRFMYEHPITQDALAGIALASYKHAQYNPRAVMHGHGP
jgi:acetyl-CoA acetyltransferase